MSAAGLARLLLAQLAALAVLALSSLGLGLPLARRLGRASVHERLVIGAGAGLGALATLLFVLGALHRLTAAAVGVLALGGTVAGALALGRERTAWPSLRPGSRWIAGLILAVGLLPAFVLGLYPPFAFDETAYHLPTAAAFARSGMLAVVPEQLFPVFPPLGELLFAGVLLLARDVAVHVVQYLALVLVAAACWAGARQHGGRLAAPLAAAIWIGNPLAHYQAGTAYVDLLLTLFVLLGVLAWERWREAVAGPIPAGRWLLASGAFLGLAAATKYHGLLWLLLMIGLTAIGAPTARLRATIRFTAAALLALAPSYLRSLLVTRNPVFPFLARWFPGSGSPFDALVGPGAGQAWIAPGAARHPWLADGAPLQLLALPWRMAFEPARFHHQSPLSPVYLLVLPAMIVAALGDARLRRWLLLVLAFALLGTADDPRFQLPTAALLAVGGGLCGQRLLARPALAHWRSTWRVGLLAALLALPGPLYAAYRLWRQGAVPATPAARDAFLAQELPGYPAVRWLDERSGRRYVLYGLGAESLAYHARGRFLGQVGGPFASRRVFPLLDEPDRLHALLACWGTDHLLVLERGGGSPLLDRPAFRARFAPLLRGDGYRLFALQPPPSPAEVARQPMTCRR